MPTDGLTLMAATREIQALTGAKVDKIMQPESDEIHIQFRKDGKNVRVLLCASSETGRVHITSSKKQNPVDAPMFCMLLRKHLTGGRLLSAEQLNSDRIVRFTFESTDELYDVKRYVLIAEIMGRCSNIILTSADGTVIDSLRRIGLSFEDKSRAVLPGLKYEYPPTVEKTDPKQCLEDDFYLKITSFDGNDMLNRALSQAYYGLSPVMAAYLLEHLGFCRETCLPLTEPSAHELAQALYAFYSAPDFSPTIIYNDDMPVLICPFTPADASSCRVAVFNSAGEALDEFYYQKDIRESMRRRSLVITHALKQNIERRERKLALYDEAIAAENSYEKFRIFGELITANIYLLKQGDKSATVTDYYSESGESVTIPLDPRKTPAHNAQLYYKKYSKAKAARDMALSMREGVLAELEYLEGQLDNVERADTAAEYADIREELEELGYVKRDKTTARQNKAARNHAESSPRKFISSDGYTIYVGKNNRQNDILTLKTAHADDIWLHIKDYPGAHVVIITNGDTVGNTTLCEAAMLAAYYSNAGKASKTAVYVDYTLRRNVKKPSGALPGKVNYVNQKTLCAEPRLCLKELI